MAQEELLEKTGTHRVDPEVEMASVTSQLSDIAANNIVKNHMIASIV